MLYVISCKVLSGHKKFWFFYAKAQLVQAVVGGYKVIKTRSLINVTEDSWRVL